MRRDLAPAAGAAEILPPLGLPQDVRLVPMARGPLPSAIFWTTSFVTAGDDPLSAPLSPGMSVAEALSLTGLDLGRPVVVFVAARGADDNLLMASVPRARWSEVSVQAGEQLVAFAPPLGGKGGSNPLRLLAMLAVMVIAAVLAPEIATALGFVKGTEAFSMATSVAFSAISMVGNFIVSALLPPPKPNQPGRGETPSPTYTLNGQGNYPRLLEAIPEQFGRERHLMDAASDDWVEFDGDEMYLHKILCAGRGRFAWEEWGFSNTAVWRSQGGLTGAFGANDVAFTIVDPGGSSRPFPDHVKTAREVSGQTLKAPDEGGGWSGPFAATAPGVTAVALACDFIFARGLARIEDSGRFSGRAVQVQVDIQRIDDAGAPLGDRFTLIDETFTRAQGDRPVRQTLKRQLQTPGRYQVWARRVTGRANDQRIVDEVSWGGLKAMMAPTPPSAWGDVSMMFIRAKASDQLNGQAANQVYAIKTRMLPWRANGAWAGEEETRAIAPALAYIAKRYLPDQKIDLARLESLHATWEARGDKLDGLFDGRRGLFEALQLAARPGRAQPLMAGGILTFVRDEPQSVYRTTIGQAQIRAGSFSLEAVFSGEETTDAVEVEFRSQKTFGFETVLARLPGGGTRPPAKLKLFGVGDPLHAMREGLFQAAANTYRRLFGSVDTEMDGRPLFPADLILVQHDLMEWGGIGIVDSILDGGSDWLVDLAEPAAGPLAAGLVALAQKTGRTWGPVPCTIASGNLARIVIPKATVPAGFGDPRPLVFTRVSANGAAEPSRATYGPAAEFAQPSRVMYARPSGFDRAVLAVCNEDSRVHTADGAPVVTPMPPFAAPPPEDVTIDSLAVSSTAGAGWVTVTVAAPGAADAVAYEVLIDDVPQATQSQQPFSFPLFAGAYKISVRARGRLGHGNWLTWTGEAGQPVPGGIFALAGFAAASVTLGSNAQLPAIRLSWTPNSSADWRGIAFQVRAQGETRIGQGVAPDAAAGEHTTTENVAPERLMEARARAIAAGGAPTPFTPWVAVTTGSVISGDTRTVAGRPAPGLVLTIDQVTADSGSLLGEVGAARRGLADLLASVSAAALSASWSGVSGRPANLAGLDAAARSELDGARAELAAARGPQPNLGARIQDVELVRDAADTALAGRATTLEARARGAESVIALNINPHFAEWPEPAGYPADWTAWGSATGWSRVAGIGSPYALRLVTTVEANQGFMTTPYDGLVNTLSRGWYVICADITLESGSLEGAAAYFQWGPSTGSIQSGWINLSTDLDTSGVAPGAGVAGRRYFYRKLVQIDGPCERGAVFAMNSWTSLSASAVAKTIVWQKCFVRPATLQEVQAQKAALTDIPALTARITTEEAVRASADTALAGRATTLEAQMADTAASGLRSRISTEEIARANADSALAVRTTNLETEVQGARQGQGSVSARLSQIDTARSDGDSALAVRATNLETEVTAARQGQASVSARLSQIDVARSDGDTALAGRATTLEARARGAESVIALNINPHFADWTNPAGFPADWAPWGYNTGWSRVTGIGSPYALRIVTTVEENHGFMTAPYDGLVNTLSRGWYVLCADITLESGSLEGAGAYLQWGPSSGSIQAGWINFSTDPDTSGVAPGAGVAGRRYFYRKLVQIDAPCERGAVFAKNSWVGISAMAVAKTIVWQKCYVRPATLQEVQAQRAALTDIPALTARITTEEAVRASADTALAGRATTLEAQMADTAASGLRSRISTEEIARANADSALAVRATTLEARATAVEGAASRSLTVNNNPQFLFWEPNGSAWFFTGGQKPVGWATLWGQGTYTRHVNADGRVVLRQTAPAGLNEWLETLTGPANEYPEVSPGRHILKASAALVSGTFSGAFAYAAWFDASYNFIAADWITLWSTPTIAGTAVGAGTAGVVHTWSKEIDLPANARRVRIAAMGHWSANDISAANSIDWYECSLTPMSAAEINSTVNIPLLNARITTEEAARIAGDSAEAAARTTLAATVGSVQAQVTTQAGAIADLNSGTAWLQQMVSASGGVPAIMKMLSGKGGSEILLAAARIMLGNVDAGGTTIREVLRLVGGDVFVINKLFVGASVVIDPDAQAIILTASSAKLVFGIGFGASSNLLLWFGPNIALSAMTLSNATLALTTTGGGRFRDTLLIGALSNAGQTSSLAADAEAVTGPFGTNGGPKTVTVSYACDWNGEGDPWIPNPSYAVSATIVVERRLGAGAWTQIGSSITVSGTVTVIQLGADPNPFFGGMSGATTITDTNSSTADFSYRARLTARTTNPGGVTGTPVSQRLSISSVE